MKNTNYLLIILIAILFMSCSKSSVFEEDIDIPDGIWNEANKVVFSFNINDTKTPYNIFFNIRSTNMYASSNLWLFVTTIAPNGSSMCDTFECVLADESGKWLGAGIGDNIDTQIAYKKNVGFPAKGTYSVQIQQGMRTPNLPFIMEVGLLVEKAKQQ